MSAPKNNGPIIDPALCRCCRAIKKCRVLTAEYTWMDKKEVYADMIMDCFGILLSHVDEIERDSGVCATCVVRLRDASAFRQQVLTCEELFLQAKLEDKDLEEPKKALDIEPKVEPKDDISEHNSVGATDHDDHDGLSLDNYSADDAELKPEKEEKTETIDAEPLPKCSTEDSDSYSSSDSDKPIKRKRKKKTSAKSNGTKKKGKGKAKKEKAVMEHTSCLNCGLSSYRERRYIVANIGSEIIQRLQQWLPQRQFSDEDFICSQCMNAVQISLDETEATQSQQRLGHQHVCVWCGRSILRFRNNALPENSPERMLIAARISPRQLPENPRVCYACWVAAKRNVQALVIQTLQGSS